MKTLQILKMDEIIFNNRLCLLLLIISSLFTGLDYTYNIYNIWLYYSIWEDLVYLIVRSPPPSLSLSH